MRTRNTTVARNTISSLFLHGADERKESAAATTNIILEAIEEYLGWRNHAMLTYPVLMHPQVTEDFVKKNPKRYKESLETRPSDDTLDSYRNIRPVCVVPWGSPLLDQFLEAHLPIVIRGSQLIKRGGSTGESKESKWTPGHIQSMLAAKKVTVYESPSQYFRYWKKEQHTGPYVFKAPTSEKSITISEFLQRVQETTKEGPAIDEDGNKKGRSGLLYLQESLSGHSEFSSEFASWNWNWLLRIVQKYGWGTPDRNILLIGMQGATTPAHYDEQENMFAQMRGRKEVYLWPPGDWQGMYAFPCNHACDRQAMVNPDNPDLHRFPLYRHARPHYAVLQPGDLLYLPVGWWHHLRNLDPLAISITFWSKQQKASLDTLKLPLDQRHLLTVRRNLEEMVFNIFGSESLQNLAKQLSAKHSSKPSTKLSEGNSKVKEFMVNCLSNFMGRTQAEPLILDMLEGRYCNDIEKWIQPNA